MDLSGQLSQAQNAYSNYSPTSPTDLYSQASDKLGLSDIYKTLQGNRQALASTQTAIANVDPNVTGRLQGGFSTEAQRQREIALERQPLADTYSTLQNALNSNQSDYSNALSQAQNMANLGWQGEQAQQNKLADIYKTSASMADSAANRAASSANNSADTGLTGLLAGLLGGGGTQGTGSMTRNAVGGYGFTNATGQPVTMAQYLHANGYGTADQIAQQAAQLLAGGSANDKAVAAAINSGKYNPAQLAKLYPQVFGGSF